MCVQTNELILNSFVCFFIKGTKISAEPYGVGWDKKVTFRAIVDDNSVLMRQVS